MYVLVADPSRRRVLGVECAHVATLRVGPFRALMVILRTSPRSQASTLPAFPSHHAETLCYESGAAGTDVAMDCGCCFVNGLVQSLVYRIAFPTCWCIFNERRGGATLCLDVAQLKGCSPATSRQRIHFLFTSGLDEQQQPKTIDDCGPD